MERRIDHYDVLGVAPDADPDVIRAAYRALAKKYHPDSRVEGKAEAEQKLRELNEAYEVLSSVVARQQYDRDRSAKSHVSRSDPIKETGKRLDGGNVDWKAVEARFPGVGFKYKQLLKISQPVAEAYRDRLVRERAFARYDQVSSELVNQFASRYFGSSKTIQRFGVWCLLNNKKDAARELNQIIAKQGSPPDPSQILSQLRAKHQIPAADTKIQPQGKMNVTQGGRRSFLIAGWLGFAAIIVVSLLPGELRPHTGLGGYVEHALAYLSVSGAFAMGSNSQRVQILSVIMVVAGAAILEALQHLVPGRTPEVLGFIAGAAGCLFGLGLASIISKIAPLQRKL